MKNKHTYPALLVALFLHCTMVSFGKQASKSILLQNDTTTVKRYIDQAYALHQQNLDTAVFISQKALKLARKLKWEKGVAQAYYDQGWYYRCKTDFDRSIACYENALNHYTILSKSAQKKQRHSGNLGIHKTLSGIGGVYMAAGNYTKALQLQFKALKLGEKLGIDKHIVLINIAQVYFYQGKFEKAKPYFEKSLGIAKKLGDKDVILANLQNLGAMAGMQGKHQEALRYHKSVLKLAHEMNANVTVAMTLANIGTEFQYQENHDSAEYYFKNALKMCEAYGSKGDVASLNGSLGLLAISRGKFAQAEQFLMRANTLALETGSLELIKASYKDLHDFYDTAHKAEMALKSYELYIAYSDSIANSENVKLQARVEMQYEFDKKHA
ncbi:MAG TPA: tetratricopeptide repeat protein, partial [Flavobacteriales bacterium]|nr:tetratricopeptide repeat protein [Flavobacteriales bacterium]